MKFFSFYLNQNNGIGVLNTITNTNIQSIRAAGLSVQYIDQFEDATDFIQFKKFVHRCIDQLELQCAEFIGIGRFNCTNRLTWAKVLRHAERNWFVRKYRRAIVLIEDINFDLKLYSHKEIENYNWLYLCAYVY